MTQASEIVVGVDLVSIPRFVHLLNLYGTSFGRQIFTPTEWETYNRFPFRLAARLAGKEAVGKAFGVGLAHMHENGIPATDIEIMNQQSGVPTIKLHGQAARLMSEKHINSFSISLTHDTNYAAAMVVGTLKELTT